jgi:hypothetical protein
MKVWNLPTWETSKSFFLFHSNFWNVNLHFLMPASKFEFVNSVHKNVQIRFCTLWKPSCIKYLQCHHNIHFCQHRWNIYYFHHRGTMQNSSHMCPYIIEIMSLSLFHLFLPPPPLKLCHTDLFVQLRQYFAKQSQATLVCSHNSIVTRT